MIVVHERAGQELAGVAIVDAVLAQDLSDALHDTAMQLALDEGVVDDMPAVVDRDVAQQIDRTGIGIDLDLGHVGAAGKGRRGVDLGDGIECADVLACEVLQADR